MTHQEQLCGTRNLLGLTIFLDIIQNRIKHKSLFNVISVGKVFYFKLVLVYTNLNNKNILCISQI